MMTRTNMYLDEYHSIPKQYGVRLEHVICRHHLRGGYYGSGKEGTGGGPEYHSQEATHR